MTRQQLVEQIFSKKTYLCVGLDTDPDKLPKHMMEQPDGMLEFNKAIINATLPYCVAYKINTAFYEALGVKGWEIMQQTVNHIPKTHFTIADAKRGDIGNTSAQYAKAFFETMNFDAVTVAPYMGADSIKPFLEFKDKWTILLGLTSNPGAQDFELQQLASGGLVYEQVLKTAAKWGSEDNLMFVVGATQADSFTNIRHFTPGHFYLVPGVGTQGGSLRDISEKAMINDCGLLVNVSRAILYASSKEDFAEEARIIAQQYQFEMQQYLRTP
jgi:orotidine-5'-phosphate decarboxylase